MGAEPTAGHAGHLRVARTPRTAAAAVLCAAGALALAAPAPALIPGGGKPTINCDPQPGASWIDRAGHSGFLRRNFGEELPQIHDVWSSTVTHLDGSNATGQDCTTTAAVVIQADSPKATAAGSATGADGSSCTYSAPDPNADHGKASCTNGAIRVDFAPYPYTGNDGTTPCTASAPQPPHATYRPPKGYVWNFRTTGDPISPGTACSDALKVINQVWQIKPQFPRRSLLHPRLTVRTISASDAPYQPALSKSTPVSTTPYEWYCQVWLEVLRSRIHHHRQTLAFGGGDCALTGTVPGYGRVSYGPGLSWTGPDIYALH